MTTHSMLDAGRALLGLLAALSAAAATAAGVLWVLDGSESKTTFGGLGITVALMLLTLAALAGRRALGVLAARTPDRRPVEMPSHPSE